MRASVRRRSTSDTRLAGAQHRAALAELLVAIRTPSRASVRFAVREATKVVSPRTRTTRGAAVATEVAASGWMPAASTSNTSGRDEIKTTPATGVTSLASNSSTPLDPWPAGTVTLRIGMAIASSTEFTREEVGRALRNPGMPLEALRRPITPIAMHYVLIHVGELARNLGVELT
jgi:hypothetical protein